MKNFGEISQDAYYDKLIVLRNNEMNQFWKRNVYLSAIQGVIISFFLQSITDPDAINCQPCLLITAFLGLLLAVCCLFIINTNRLWFEYYEDKIKNFEQKISTENGENVLKFGLFDDDEGRTKTKSKIFYVSTKKMCLVTCGIFGIYWLSMIIIIVNNNYLSDFLSLLPKFTAISMIICYIFYIICYIFQIICFNGKYKIEKD